MIASSIQAVARSKQSSPPDRARTEGGDRIHPTDRPLQDRSLPRDTTHCMGSLRHCPAENGNKEA
jgi:hypothetical protein